MKLCDMLGLVYFGHVNQYSDEYSVMRGYTVSPTHEDRHYCVGTYNNYDISLVVRSDSIYSPSKRRNQDYHMTILGIDLHRTTDISHLYVGHMSHEAIYASKPSYLTTLPDNMLPMAKRSFHQHYAVRSSPQDVQRVQELMGVHVTTVISQQFDDASIEIVEKTLYMYLLEEHPSLSSLKKMLANAMWFANMIDPE